MAAIWNLPVVFVCENNQYAMSMPASFSIPVTQVSQRAVAYGIPGASVDGMDVLAVHAAATEAVERARRGEGPTLLELVTYRYRGHSKSDKELYRTKAEVEEWREKDPIARFQAWMIAHDLLDQTEAAAFDDRAEAQIEAAIDYADGEPPPSHIDRRRLCMRPSPGGPRSQCRNGRRRP